MYLFECGCQAEDNSEFVGPCQYCFGSGCAWVSQAELDEAQRPLTAQEEVEYRRLCRMTRKELEQLVSAE